MKIDFNELEAEVIKKFKETTPSVNNNDVEGDLVKLISSAAARVSVIAIREYHRKLYESEKVVTPDDQK